MSASENQIVVYQPNETVRLDVRLENETVWLTQARLGVLFGVDRTVVNRHIHNIYKTGELEESATCAKIAQVQNEGGRSITRIVPFYNLDKKRVSHHKISDADIATFNAQYPHFAVRYNESFHDRFLIVDDKELYLIGASLKNLGKKCFGFTKMDAGEIERIKKAAFGER
jgi:hypothetical protein